MPPAKSSLFDQVFRTFMDGSAPVESSTLADSSNKLSLGSLAVTFTVFVTRLESEAVCVII